MTVQTWQRTQLARLQSGAIAIALDTDREKLTAGIKGVSSKEDMFLMGAVISAIRMPPPIRPKWVKKS